MLENTEGAIKNGQVLETGNTRHTRRRKTKQIHSTRCVGHKYTQTNANKTVRKVFRYQRGNQKPWIEEQTA